jgi:hypothetical protein
MNNSIVIRHWKVMVLLLGVLLILSGCAGYPLNMSKQEWHALTPQQQAEAHEKQEKIGRYEADDMRCRKDAERKVNIRYPQGSFSSNQGRLVTAQGEMDILLGVEGELYRRCMVKAGWEVQLTMEKEPWKEVPGK